MLKVTSARRWNGSGLRVGVIAARYNAKYVDGMRRAARACLEGAGVEVEEFRVPGSFEIPVAAAALARRETGRPDALVCLGVIWQGETDHAQHIGAAVTTALMALQVETGVPCIHAVLTLQSEQQARVRCLGERTNRGLEAAQTAIQMGRLLRRLRLNNGAGNQSIR